MDDCVVLICGEPPHSQLLRIDLVKQQFASSIACKLEDVVSRASTGFCCGVICGEYVLIGASTGQILVADLATFKFVPSMTINFPASIRGGLDLRARTLNQMRSKQRKGERKKGVGGAGGLPPTHGSNGSSSSSSNNNTKCPCVELHVSGPQIVGPGQSRKIIAKYADGTVCVHSLFSKKKVDATNNPEAGAENKNSDNDNLISMTHSQAAGSVNAVAWMPQNSTIPSLNDRSTNQTNLLLSGGSDQSIHIWKSPSSASLALTPNGSVEVPSLGPVACIDVPKSLNEQMSYRNCNMKKGMAGERAKRASLDEDESCEFLRTNIIPKFFGSLTSPLIH